MIKVENSITIDRPVDEVFTFLANLENAPKWQSGLTDSRKLSSGPLGVGSRFEETIRIIGRPIKTICEITAYELDRSMVFKSDSSSVIKYMVEFSFHQMGNGTRVEAKSETQLGGIWRLLEILFAKEVKRESEAELRRAKEVIEAEAAG